jgi:hypothetical protein
MRTQKQLCCFLIFYLFDIGIAQAQSVVPAAGGTVKSSGGSVSYTVGQIAYTTQIGIGGSVAQGIQQAYEITVVTGVDIPEISLQCMVYPNPVNEMLKLKIDQDNLELFRYQFYDLNGNLLMDNKIEGTETTIYMDGLAHTEYFLKVFEGKKEIKVFKIVKN